MSWRGASRGSMARIHFPPPATHPITATDRVPAVTSKNPVLQCTMTKVGQSDGKGTFAGTRGNDEVAPIAATRPTDYTAGSDPHTSFKRPTAPC
jgi:hypothetical protein